MVAGYHDARLAELVAHAAEAIDRFRGGEVDAFRVDEVLFRYSRATRSSGSSATSATLRSPLASSAMAATGIVEESHPANRALRSGLTRVRQCAVPHKLLETLPAVARRACLVRVKDAVRNSLANDEVEDEARDGAEQEAEQQWEHDSRIPMSELL